MTTRRLLPSLGLLLLVATPARAVITFTDPANYGVKHTWSGVSLGIPGPLGGLMFSPDGNTLYAVGASERTNSALYAVPVTRDPSTHEVTDLGPDTSVTKVFDGNPSTAGLDAGLEFGPAGTFFYTYWPSNRLGERPGGIGGSEGAVVLLLEGYEENIEKAWDIVAGVKGESALPVPRHKFSC